MSLPFTRRIAQAALLVAAGAAPLVGAAGSASAAQQPKPTDLGGLTNLDHAELGSTVDAAAKKAGKLAKHTGGEPVRSAIPTAGDAAAPAGDSTLPAAKKAVGKATKPTRAAVGRTVRSTGNAADSTLDSVKDRTGLPVHASTDQTPVGDTPLTRSLF